MTRNDYRSFVYRTIQIFSNLKENRLIVIIKFANHAFYNGAAISVPTPFLTDSRRFIILPNQRIAATTTTKKINHNSCQKNPAIIISTNLYLLRPNKNNSSELLIFPSTLDINATATTKNLLCLQTTQPCGQAGCRTRRCREKPNACFRPCVL